jgi:L-amino acid N-acyltransferase YncA
MSDATIMFRDAEAEDWDAIWPIVHEVVRAGETYPYPPDLGEDDARQLWMPDPERGQRTYVAEREGRVVATAYVRPNMIGLGDHVANAGWMVSSAERGTGIGRAFGTFVLDEARSLGFTAMQFNAVVATNAASIALWESLGFVRVGTVPDAFRHATAGPTAIHIMYRAL